MARWRNVRRGDPCGLCGKPSWCSRSDDGAWALCRRVDAGGEHRVDRAGMDYWLHRLAGDPRPAPEIPDEPAAERAGAGDLDRVYRTLLGRLSLSPAHRETLLRRGLDEDAVEEGLYRSLPKTGGPALARELLDRFPARLLATVPGFCTREGTRGPYPSFVGAPGLLIPVLDLDGFVVALKVRRDDDDPRYLYVSSSGRGGPGPGAPVHVSRWNEPAWNESARMVRITEGELKADVATALSGVLTISVPGVSAWRGALPVLRTLKPATVLLAFDADAASNPHVARAADATAEALAAESWEVAVESWDSALAKGIDDALAARVPIETTTRTPPDRAPDPTTNGAELQPTESPYRATHDGLVWTRPTKDGTVETRLTNFVARIASDVVEDDGVEVRRRFEVEARLNGWCRRFTIPAEAFPSMGWATEHLGARAIVMPGMGLRDHARAAVQVLSEGINERHVYAHSGWRQLESGWAYLHAGGAVGETGPVPGVEVALPDALAPMVLADPPTGDDLAAAVRASLAILDTGPEPVTIPLLAAVYRSVLGPCDFALHLAGSTGAGKSELAALIQRHFGPGFDARHLPGSWSSTANALEALAFSAADAVLVVDDFAPTNGAGDADRAHRDADRLLRAQGNRSGRLRMRPDGSLRACKPPRGLILSTGEDLPRGQSLRSRVLVVEVGRFDVDWSKLTDCQAHAGAGRLAQALAGFLRWIAGRYETTQGQFIALLPKLRARAAASGAHRRTPEIVANLAAGFGLFLAFARTTGALSDAEHAELLERGWRALGEAARAQAAHQAPAEPARRFLELLAGAMSSGRAHVAAPDGKRPNAGGGTWGWRLNAYGTHEPMGDRVGWLEGEDLYLDPDAAYAAVQRLGQEIGDRIALTPQTLRKRLKERGILATCETQRRMLTVRRTLEGQRREVLHLQREALCASTGDSDFADTQDALWSAPAGGVVAPGSAPATDETGLSPAVLAPVGDLVGIFPQEIRPEHSRNGKEGMW